MYFNKIDLTEEWAVALDAVDALRQRGWDVRFSSAKTGAGVDEIFFDLASRLIPDDGAVDAER